MTIWYIFVINCEWLQFAVGEAPPTVTNSAFTLAGQATAAYFRVTE